MFSLKKQEEGSSERFLLHAKNGLRILWLTKSFYRPKHHHLKRAIFRLFCSLVELTQPPIGHQWHISILTQWT